MPKIRLGETSKVPLDTDGRKVRFLLQHIESGAVVNECLGGKTHKKLRERHASAPEGLKCYAVWNGKYYKDLFDIDIPVMLERLDNLKKRRNARTKPKE